MKKLFLGILLLKFSTFLAACGSDETSQPKDENAEQPSVEENKDQTEETPDDGENSVEQEESTKAKVDFKAEAEANAVEYPAGPGKMLYDKAETKFKGMQYHFKGELVKVEKVEGLLGNMADALLVKNDKGYVMPIFPPFEIDAVVGDEIEAWGPLSGDGYASSDLGVDNVAGVVGSMNATQINVNGEMK